jgi:hypothetical protein
MGAVAAIAFFWSSVPNPAIAPVKTALASSTMPWHFLHRLSTKNHRQIEANPFVSGPVHLSEKANKPNPATNQHRPVTFAVGESRVNVSASLFASSAGLTISRSSRRLGGFVSQVTTCQNIACLQHRYRHARAACRACKNGMECGRGIVREVGNSCSSNPSYFNWLIILRQLL